MILRTTPYHTVLNQYSSWRQHKDNINVKCTELYCTGYTPLYFTVLSHVILLIQIEIVTSCFYDSIISPSLSLSFPPSLPFSPSVVPSIPPPLYPSLYTSLPPSISYSYPSSLPHTIFLFPVCLPPSLSPSLPPSLPLGITIWTVSMFLPLVLVGVVTIDGVRDTRYTVYSIAVSNCRSSLHDVWCVPHSPALEVQLRGRTMSSHDTNTSNDMMRTCFQTYVR